MATSTTSASAAPAPTAPPPHPGVPAREARAPNGEIGTAAPVVVESVARDGGWVVFCQARTDSDGDGNVSTRIGPGGKLIGDEVQRFFARGAGLGENIDDLLTRDDSGRWVVVTRSGAASLIDTDTGHEVRLDSLDLRDDSLSFRPHRAVAFDASGSRLVYLRGTGKDARIVVRASADGVEKILEAGDGDIWRVEFEPTGRYVVVRLVVDDTNRDKKLSWPAPARTGPRPCRGPVTTYDAWVGRGDSPVVRLIPLDGGKPETVPGFVTTLGDGVVVREAPGRLLLRRAGKTEELSGERCGARVVHVDHEREQLVVACTKPKGRPKLELISVGKTLALDADVAHQSQDLTDGSRARLFALYPGNDTKLLDLSEKKLLPLAAGDAVLASHGGRSLVRRKRSLLLHDADRSSERPLEAALSPSLDSIAEPPMVVAAPAVVNIDTERLVGTISGRPLGLAPDGKVLIARGRDSDGTELATGPLVWQTPSALPGAK